MFIKIKIGGNYKSMKFFIIFERDLSYLLMLLLNSEINLKNDWVIASSE
jgi:hypothetical protein